MIDISREQNSSRRHQRSTIQALFRVYSSVVAGSQMINVLDLSQGGAFFATRLMPEVNETVTCRAIDLKGTELFSINARVAWINDKAYAGKVGFGVEFHRLLTPEQEQQIKSLQNGFEPSDGGFLGRPLRRRF